MINQQTTKTMNLYILNEVLSDYTSGMAVIAAPSKERACELFIEEFGEYYADELKNAEFTEIRGVTDPDLAEGLVDYVYGGG
jgi:hypothetical protein